MRERALTICVLFLAGGALALGAPPELGIPIECEIGKTCFIQNYVDRDSSDGASDYACGTETYDGHRGTDIRLVDTAAARDGVAVVAAAPGVVVATRDGVADRLVKTLEDRQAVAGKECGNGVVVDHGEAWVTQYCHMLNRSVRVQKGAAVAAGAKLGEVGYSGDVQFPHLHLSVRHNGVNIDPFIGVQGGDGCGVGDRPLWTADAISLLSYQPTRLLRSGLSDRAVELDDLETGAIGGFVADRMSPALVSWGWAINLRAGDEVTAALAGPGGTLAHNRVIVERDKAQYMMFAGKRRPDAGWPPGPYTAEFSVVRGGEPVINAATPFDVR
ncbi:MAG: M23 family metallopeptidase [Betaproteobacteria bacterium]|nr:M23 family metallopeptidase [Betaproteobacteria bacterium]